ncbi:MULTISPECIES: GNAT family N-acetyltransferase [Paenibacillus]|nr:GNAT family N-acetyltransferase [Paenibacillus sp. p3-SID1389]MCT2196264.1 GNAT family N-acetyltransferase [Paenibacillus sp. p3-SID1389]
MNDFERVYEIMSASFPEIEYRTKSGQMELLWHPEYRLITESDEKGQIIAFLAAWEFPTFRFIEHLAVDPSVRGGGIGKRLVDTFLKSSDKLTILEVELPENNVSCRRIRFYERLGFHLNDYSYVQPPLRSGGAELPLKIMSYPKPLTQEEFLACRALIYSKVYRVPEA